MTAMEMVQNRLTIIKHGSIVFGLLLMIMLCSCNAANHKALSEVAAVEFHARFNSTQYESIYLLADDGFRRNSNKKDFIDLIASIHQHFGAVQQSHLRYYVDGRLTSEKGAVVTLVYDTTLEHGRCVEKFVFRIANEKANLLSYNIEP